MVRFRAEFSSRNEKEEQERKSFLAREGDLFPFVLTSTCAGPDGLNTQPTRTEMAGWVAGWMDGWTIHTDFFEELPTILELSQLVFTINVYIDGFARLGRLCCRASRKRASGRYLKFVWHWW